MHLVCIKYELMYSYAKSRDPFYLRNSFFFAVCTLRWGNGHYAWPHGSWKQFWGNPPICQLPAEDWSTPYPLPHESKESQAKKRKQAGQLPPLEHKHLSVLALPALDLFWKTLFISVLDQLPIDNYALPSFYTSLYTTWFFSLCAFWMDIPKKKKQLMK